MMPRWLGRIHFRTFCTEFFVFGVKQANACIFAGIFLAFIILSHFWYPPTFLHRYDFLFLVALLIQVTLIVCKMEKRSEIFVICLFHVLATVMELFKTSVGSWSYPERAVMHVAGVPLFAGFMYSAVGSYIARVWRIFAFRFAHFPPLSYVLVISALIYINFFTHHYIVDIRYVLLFVILCLFYRTQVIFTIIHHERRMPLLVGLLLVSLFIWFAENIGTYCRVWFYPNQIHGWTMVSPSKLIAWFLLMFISFSLVYLIHQRKSKPPNDD